MEKYLEISAIDCFIGLVDAAAYQGFIGDEVDYETLELRILQQMKQGKLLFWGTTTPHRWTIRLVDQRQTTDTVQEFKGYLHVSQKGLHLINYAMLMDAAQFEEDALTEQALQLVALPKGWYQVTVCQLFHPDQDTLMEECLGFEIILTPLSQTPSLSVNTLEKIPWSIY